MCTFWQRETVLQPVRRRATVVAARADPRPPVIRADPVVPRHAIAFRLADPAVKAALGSSIVRVRPSLPQPITSAVAALRVPPVVPLSGPAVLASLALPATAAGSLGAAGVPRTPLVDIAAPVAVRSLAAILAPSLGFAVGIPVTIAVALAALLGVPALL